MVFSSLIFLFCFLPTVLAAYWLAPKRFRNAVLLAASLVFYAWGGPQYVPIMLFCAAAAFTGGKCIAFSLQGGREKAARTGLAVSVVVTLLPLVFFKYFAFVAESFCALFGLPSPSIPIPLPAGISFYSFQAVSYLVDVYRGEACVQKNPFDFCTYIALFPQLVAGPIVRYSKVERQLSMRTETVTDVAEGIRCFVIGLGKKVLLANNIGLLWESAQALAEKSAATAWIALAAYTFQIYFDFSGYSDMAMGLGRMFGFSFPKNFDFPYCSKSVTEFWRRWHISLGTWFREYVYIPLGGNRGGTTKTVRNILVVWMLTGIWHGARWNFVFWGLYYGALLLLEKFVLHRALEKIPALLRHAYCMFCIMLGWAFFACGSASECTTLVKTLFGADGVPLDAQAVFFLRNNVVLFLLCLFGSTHIPMHIGNRLCDRCKNPALRFIMQNGFFVAVLLLSVAYLVDSSFNPFLYFRF
ncbi:MAG: MBOAT family protein [Treponemataceae bacterium]|nr:MBOAT family protein [Treponemataceae bacterium]